MTQGYIGATITVVKQQVLFVGTHDTATMEFKDFIPTLDAMITNASDDPWDYNNPEEMKIPC